jgi:DNA-3-methyladenine glycosylase II
MSQSIPNPWRAAQNHLRKIDPVFGPLIEQAGPCRLRPRRDHFVALCNSIFSQQISTRVAAVLFARFRDQFPRRRPTPPAVLQLLSSGDQWRQCGLSRQKRDYLMDLARHFDSGELAGRRLSRMEDEEVIQTLTQVKGVGRWTAEMFLMFVLNRPDVLPVDDLGLRKGAQKAYALSELPTAARLREIGQVWRPWRSVATWYLWRGLETTNGNA